MVYHPKSLDPKLRQAFHATTPAAFESILEDGVLVPLGMRADDESIRTACERDISNGRYKDTRAGETVRELVELFLKKRPAYDKRISFPEKNVHSGCLEIIFSYGTGVLLNAGGFLFIYGPDPKQRGVYGFVYDSQGLLENGGRVITEAFDNEMRVRMEASPPSTLDEIIRLAEASQAASELTGTPAFDYIRKYQTGYYILWPGPLPVEMAEEIWENGKLMKRGKVGRIERP